eukprot:6197235-Pleurochrysis_carterae.AAC.3
MQRPRQLHAWQTNVFLRGWWTRRCLRAQRDERKKVQCGLNRCAWAAWAVADGLYADLFGACPPLLAQLAAAMPLIILS